MPSYRGLMSYELGACNLTTPTLDCLDWGVSDESLDLFEKYRSSMHRWAWDSDDDNGAFNSTISLAPGLGQLFGAFAAIDCLTRTTFFFPCVVRNTIDACDESPATYPRVGLPWLRLVYLSGLIAPLTCLLYPLFDKLCDLEVSHHNFVRAFNDVQDDIPPGPYYSRRIYKLIELQVHRQFVSKNTEDLDKRIEAVKREIWEEHRNPSKLSKDELNRVETVWKDVQQKMKDSLDDPAGPVGRTVYRFGCDTSIRSDLNRVLRQEIEKTRDEFIEKGAKFQRFTKADLCRRAAIDKDQVVDDLLESARKKLHACMESIRSVTRDGFFSFASGDPDSEREFVLPGAVPFGGRLSPAAMS